MLCGAVHDGAPTVLSAWVEILYGAIGAYGARTLKCSVDVVGVGWPGVSSLLPEPRLANGDDLMQHTCDVTMLIAINSVRS